VTKEGGDEDVIELNWMRGCGKGGVGGVRNRQPSTVSDNNGRGEGAG
jgi:hypothetical protein